MKDRNWYFTTEIFRAFSRKTTKVQNASSGSTSPKIQTYSECSSEFSVFYGKSNFHGHFYRSTTRDLNILQRYWAELTFLKDCVLENMNKTEGRGKHDFKLKRNFNIVFVSLSLRWRSWQKVFQSKTNNLSGDFPEKPVHSRVCRAVNQVGILIVFAVVVQRLQIVYYDGIAKQLRENVPPDELRRDFLEDVLFVFVNFVGLASRAGALVGCVR